MTENKLFLNDKEIFILNSLPSVFYTINALSAYKMRESFGYMNAILAFSMESNDFPEAFFNEYSLTLRGRQSQGVTLFK